VGTIDDMLAGVLSALIGNEVDMDLLEKMEQLIQD
jgi:hypothetical protein